MANVMKPGRVSGPYADTLFIPTTTHGWVHANTWYASVPFNSAPPPAPAGINPQIWANGQWQPNPYFRPPTGMTQPPNTFQMWAPHPGWGPAVAGSQSWNPYKRVPNPGDASYWATQLSDNPLMLENMHIKDDTPAEERHRKDSSNGVPHTPWVWVPKELSSDASKSAGNTGVSASHDGQGGQSQQTHSQRDPVHAPSAYRRDGYDHTRTSSSSRNAYVSPATAHDASSQSRHYQYDASRSAPTANDNVVASSAPPTVSTYSAYYQQQQQQRQQQERQPQQLQHDSHRTSDRYTAPSQQQPDSGQHRRRRSRDVSPRPSYDTQAYSSRDYRSASTATASSSASAAAAATAATASRQSSTDYMSSARSSRDREHERDEAFSSRRELLPTFSPNIVRTPDHYHSPSARLAGQTDPERTPTRHPASTPTPSHGQIYTPAAAPARSNSLNAGRQSSQGPNISPNSSLGLISFTEEPDSVLSPLIVPGTPPASSRPSQDEEVGRSSTYPSVAFASNHYSEHERPVYRKTPRDPPRSLSAERRDRRDYGRSRDVDATIQPGTRTPPAHHTPPLSHYTRPSPDSRSGPQPISRSQTYPVVAPPPPVTPQRSRSPPRSSPSHAQSQSQSYPSSSSSPYQYSNSASYKRTPPNPLIPPISSTTSPLRHNPLPRPPQASPYAESFTRGSSSASAAAAAVAAQQQSTHRRPVRQGYWNRRGDHLYIDERGQRFIVYAPRHLANPEELKHYPSPTEGWKDHHGNFMKYDPNVPELLDSLPLHGEPPTRPYQQVS
ncbi:hypothetical protein BD414DRAFT_416020 [Trametes punicea]|nr:hypothetical protein BD414DRAFT_416020 [Trametes punicea]